MTLRSEPLAEDLADLRRWFVELGNFVRAVDYEGAYRLFSEDLIAFGTFSDFVEQREVVVAEQWRNVWPTIRRFRFRADSVRAIVSPDRLAATGLGIFDSDGFKPDGSRFDRSGRASVVFSRSAIGAPFVAVHTHLSLFRGSPSRSYGWFTGAESAERDD